MSDLFMFQFVKKHAMQFVFVLEALQNNSIASGIVNTSALDLNTPEEYEFTYSYFHDGNKDHEESFTYKFYPHINKGIYSGKESNFNVGEIVKYVKISKM